jgi:hypothetical protein
MITAFERPLPPPPAHDPTRPTAVVVAGNVLTESTDPQFRPVAELGLWTVWTAERRVRGRSPS